MGTYSSVFILYSWGSLFWVPIKEVRIARIALTCTSANTAKKHGGEVFAEVSGSVAKFEGSRYLLSISLGRQEIPKEVPYSLIQAIQMPRAQALSGLLC